MRKLFTTIVAFSLTMTLGLPCLAGDNELTAQEKSAGWKLLFNGKDLAGWKCNNGKPVATPIEDGSILPYKAGGYVVVYDKPFGDFILKCDVKMTEPYCNSGVFLRVGDLKNPVYTGFEIQVYKPGTSVHDFGAIYDLVPPSKNALNGPGKWDSMKITCKGPNISVEVNGQLITEIDCDKWDKKGLRLDGSKHKFGVAIKDLPRKGYLGFQDHGKKAWFKNIKLLEL